MTNARTKFDINMADKISRFLRGRYFCRHRHDFGWLRILYSRAMLGFRCFLSRVRLSQYQRRHCGLREGVVIRPGLALAPTESRSRVAKEVSKLVVPEVSRWTLCAIFVVHRKNVSILNTLSLDHDLATPSPDYDAWCVKNYARWSCCCLRQNGGGSCTIQLPVWCARAQLYWSIGSAI